jgi:hypothetical protein
MLVLLRVLFAFFRAESTRNCASLDHCLQHFSVRSNAPGCKRSSRRAHIGTIEIQSNTLAKHRELLLREACIGTSRAGLGARITGLDASDQRLADAALHVGMSRDHFTDMHDTSPAGGCVA